MSNDFRASRKNYNNLMKMMNDYFQNKRVPNVIRQIDDFFAKPMFPSSFPLKINETDDEYVITAELAGVNKEQIKLSFFQNELKITIRNLDQYREEGLDKTTYEELSLSEQARTVKMPFAINKQTTQASYKNGLLVIKIKKEDGEQIKID